MIAQKYKRGYITPYGLPILEVEGALGGSPRLALELTNLPRGYDARLRPRFSRMIAAQNCADTAIDKMAWAYQRSPRA